LSISGDTIVYGDPTLEIVSYLTVTNNSSQSLDIICEKNVISLPQGADNYFCWGGSCYTSSTIISPDFTTIDASQFSTEFQGHFSEMSNPISAAVIEYCFYPITDPLDATCLTVKFEGSPSSSVDLKERHIIASEFYPNPSKEIVHFDYYLNNQAKLILIDILGNELRTIPLSSKGIQNINIQDLPKGIYFGNVLVNNEIVSTKKLIVK
jgi:hypothetical protein